MGPGFAQALVRASAVGAPRREATRGGWARCYDVLMSVEYFDERREMVAAIRVIAKHLAAEIGKTAPWMIESLGQWPKYRGMSSCRSRSSRMLT
jgi:hypothetical protein